MRVALNDWLNDGRVSPEPGIDAENPGYTISNLKLIRNYTFPILQQKFAIFTEQTGKTRPPHQRESHTLMGGLPK
ncbi:hypothetical protein Pan241w_43320 [Gimesia alba]|uniref:Uncharacterized protein n=1 Tax=Gimesia alba TaxID=2527973 RepID=A0A517RK43_9PLAN|nr:hypothetical protein Pan241w_43320 [Gimesia alba]